MSGYVVVLGCGGEVGIDGMRVLMLGGGNGTGIIICNSEHGAATCVIPANVMGVTVVETRGALV
jgi:hypothetical protein